MTAPSLTESVAICRYLELLNPAPALFGTTPEQQATIEMWNRRMEQRIFKPLGAVGSHTFELFKGRVEQFPEYAEAQKRLFLKNISWLNGEMADGRAFVAGETFSVADITGMAVLLLCGLVQVDIPDDLAHIKKWEAAVRARPSFPADARLSRPKGCQGV